jgi:hypothetical protein
MAYVAPSRTVLPAENLAAMFDIQENALAHNLKFSMSQYHTVYKLRNSERVQPYIQSCLAFKLTQTLS